MTVRWETIQVEGKTMRIYLGVPDRPGPHPGIIVAQHAGGVDAQIQDAVHRLHREGCVAAAPELFHRQAPDVDPAKRSGLLRDDEIIADLNATIAHLKTLRMTIAPLGVVGFCMGGPGELPGGDRHRRTQGGGGVLRRQYHETAS